MPSSTLVFKEKLAYKTPMGVDDRGVADEDRVGYLKINDLMSNDHGGTAAAFYGINQADPRIASSTATSKLGAKLTVNSSTGEISYDPTAAYESLIQSLAAGETVEDNFSYTIRMSNGALSTATVTLTVTGMNDFVLLLPATTDTGGVTEDGTALTSGTIHFTDDDLSDSHSVTFAAAASNTTALGVFGPGSLDEAAGAAGGTVGWSYTLDNAAAQHLGAGETVIERYEVTISDGKGGAATRVVEVTITGANDSPYVTSRPGDSAGADLTEANGSLSASGTSTLVDLDATDILTLESQNVKVFLSDDPPSSDTLVNTAGLSNTDLTDLGLTRAEILSMFTVSPTGGGASYGHGLNNVTWEFDSGTDAFDFLREDQTLTFYYNQVRPDDGHGLTTTGDGGFLIKITGTNDAPVIAYATGADRSVTEDESDATLTATGRLTISDPDRGESNFQTNVHTYGTTWGQLTIEADGSYTYTVDNSLVQGLKSGERHVELFTVFTGDDTGQNVSFSIWGQDETRTANLVVGFEDQTTSQGVKLSDGYKGFNWDVPSQTFENLWAINRNYLPGTGYEKGTIGTHSAYTPAGSEPLKITRSNGDNFEFLGVMATAAWDEEHDVQFTGYDDAGNVVGTHLATINNDAPTEISVNWGEIDRLEVDLVAFRGAANGRNMVFDNFEFIV